MNAKQFRANVCLIPSVLCAAFLAASAAISPAGVVEPITNPASGDLDPYFDAGSSINASDFPVSAMAQQSDGKIIIGGEFTSVAGAVRGRLARLNADGSNDGTFMNGLAGFDSTVECVAVQADGKIVAGGWFQNVHGVPRNRIARLNADGSLDTTFQNNMTGVFTAGSLTAVYALAIQPDGKILIGGDFTRVNGIVRARAARLNPDGSLDPTFVDPAISSWVFSLAVQLDGKVLVGGSYSSVGGTPHNRIARLLPNGEPDAAFQTGTGASNTVTCITVQPDGKIVVGGHFNQFNGTPHYSVARLEINGSVDATFQNPAHLEGDGVAAMALQPNGKVLLGGDIGYYAVGLQRRGGLVRLNADGTRDISFDQTRGANGPVDALLLQPDGNVLIGGRFTMFDGVPRVHVGRVKGNDGTLDSAFENGPPGPNEVVEALAVQSDGKVYIGGAFGFINHSVRNRIARLNADGSLDLDFQNGMTGASADVSAIAVQFDNKVVIGGIFQSVNGVARQRLARLEPDGSLDMTFPNPLLNAPVNSIVATLDNKLLVSGVFTSVNGVTRNRIARFHSNGTLDLTFSDTTGGPNDDVHAMARLPNGKLLIGGRFTSVSGTPRGRIARLDQNGFLDPAFLTGLAGANAPVRWIAVQPDGKILIAGAFTSMNGLARGRVARLNDDGSLDNTFGDGEAGANGQVLSAAPQPDGTVLIGGLFNIVNAAPRHYIALLNADGSLNPAIGSDGANNGVYAMTMASGGKLLLSGQFTQVRAQSRDRVARLLGDHATAISPGDDDGDGLSNLAEFATGGSFGSPGGGPPATAVQIGSGVEYTYTRNKAAVGEVQFRVEWSTDLNPAAWNTAYDSGTVISDNGTTEQVKVTVPDIPASRAFFRLNVSVAPRITEVQPSIVTANQAGGQIYLVGQHLNSSLRIRINGQILSNLTQEADGVLSANLPPLAAGTYDIELIDGAADVVATVTAGLEITAGPGLRIEGPPVDGFSTSSDDGSRLFLTAASSLRLYSGECTHTVEDLRIRGRRMDFVWSRTYRSRLGPNTSQGNGWNFNHNIYLEQQGTNIVMHSVDGREDTYRRQPNGTYARDGFSAVLVKEANGTLEMVSNDTYAAGHQASSLENVQITSLENVQITSLENVQITSLRDAMITSNNARDTSDARTGTAPRHRTGASLSHIQWDWLWFKSGASDDRTTNSYTLPTRGGSTGILRQEMGLTDGVVWQLRPSAPGGSRITDPAWGTLTQRIAVGDEPEVLRPSVSWGSPTSAGEGYLDLNDPDICYTGGSPTRSAQTVLATFFPLDGGLVAGKIASLGDVNGNSLTFSYNLAGQLITINDALDRETTVSYNANGLISSVTDFMGRQVLYSYYQIGEPGGNPGDLKSVRSPVVTGTPNGNDFAQGKTVIYTYSTGFADEALNHNLLTVTDASGQVVLENTYAATTNATDLAFDRVASQSTPKSANPAQMDSMMFSWALQTPTYANGYLVLKAFVNDRAGNVSEHFFDSGNRLIGHRAFTGRAGPGLPVTGTLNRPTGKLRITDPDYYETLYQYNTDHHLTEVVYPNGSSMEFDYELDLNLDAPRLSRGNLRKIRHLPGAAGGGQPELVHQFDYTPAVTLAFGPNLKVDRLTRYVDARLLATTYRYDTKGNLTKVTAPLAGAVTDMGYNQFGQITDITYPANDIGYRRRDKFVYHNSGPENGYLSQFIEDFGGQANGVAFSPNAVGLVERVVDPLGKDTLFTYNALGQVMREQSPEIAPGIRCERLVWYDANNQIVRSDEENRDETGELAANTHFTTLIGRDALGLVTRIAREKRSANLGNNILDYGAVPVLQRDQFAVSEFGYDANQKMTLMRSPEAVNGHQPNNVIAASYDERKLLFRVTHAPGDAGQSTTQFDYNPVCQLIMTTRPTENLTGAHVTSFTYDGYGLCKSITDPMGNVEHYSFDAGGNLLNRRIMGELNDVAGSTANVRLFEEVFTYDDVNRLTQRGIAHFDTQTQAPIGDGYSSTVWAYAPDSRVRQETNDRGYITTFAQDTTGRLSRITDAGGNSRQFSYNANSEIIGIEDTDISDTGGPDEHFVTTLQRNSLGRVTSVIDSAGNVSQTGHDSRGLPVLSIDARGNVTRRAFDGLGCPVTTTRVLTATGYGSGGFVGEIKQGHLCDDSSRLIARSDGKGNVTAFQYDSLNRLTLVTHADQTQHQSTYDVHGNMITHVDANGTMVTAQFDLNNRLLARSIAPGAGVSEDTTTEGCQYDGLGRLVRAWDNDSVATFAWSSLPKLCDDGCIGLTAIETLNGLTTTHIYDGAGNETGTVYPGSLSITRTFNALNRASTITADGENVAGFKYIGGRSRQK